MTEVNGIENLEAKLDILIKLVALIAAPADASLKDRVIKLYRAGLTPKEIAALCDTTRNTVSVMVSAAKKSKPKKHR